MNKIILTENDIKLVMEGAIEILLNELDWKTYHSASTKEKDGNRANKFASARNKSFNDKFGYDDNDGNNINMSTDIPKQASIHINLKHPKERESFTDNTSNDRNMYSHSIRPNDGYNNMSGYSEIPNTESPKMARKIEKAHNEFSDFKNGKTKYIKGQGYKTISDPSIERGDGKPNTQDIKNQDWHRFLKKNN